MRKLYSKPVEITQSENQKKRIKDNVNIIRDSYDTAEHTAMHTMGVSKEGKINKGTKAYLKK